MSWLLTFALLAGWGDVTTASHPPSTPRCAPLSGGIVERAVNCRWECLCFRTNGYRCRRYYTEPCAGKACWQCQAQVSERARKSCSIGHPVKSCWCKFNKL